MLDEGLIVEARTRGDSQNWTARATDESRAVGS